MDFDPPELLALADWRRRVFNMYREVREAPDARAAWHRWRSLRDELFRNHTQSPIPVGDRDGFSGLTYFDYNPAARVIAAVEPVEPSTWSFDASEGTLTLDCAARASFELFGERLSLNLYWFRSYGGGLFVSFRDGTSGRQTYGGCRYLLDTVKGADLGMQAAGLVLDFNFAYQPSCSYDPRWVCPLAPPENRLGLEVRAGERL
ncbi:MAG: DUF1684 domain-containing protein [Actinomycetota bacterium]